MTKTLIIFVVGLVAWLSLLFGLQLAQYNHWRIGAISRLLHPGLSECMRCRTSWGIVEGHSTNDTIWRDIHGNETGGEGLFPLCEQCWGDLTPEERLPYYRQLWLEWYEGNAFNPPADETKKRELEDRWPRIERAVMEGK